MPNLTDSQPDSGKKGPQPHAERSVPDIGPGQKAEIIARPDVSPADGEAVIQEDPPQPQQEGGVGQMGPPGPEGPQEAIPDPQGRPQQQAAKKAVGCCFRSHRKSLRQPVCRGSSYTRAETVPFTATWPPSRERVFSCKPCP